MDSAPLPPHERTWRHPSEVGPTPADIDESTQTRVGALAGGAVAVLLIATLVVTLTPRPDVTGPVATGATTVPPSAQTVSAATSGADAAAQSIRSVQLPGVNAIPSAIADVPDAAFRSAADDEASPVVLPDLDDEVLVLTDQFAYAVHWRDVASLDIASDAIVVAADGAVVARFEDGRLVVSHDLLVGAALAAD